ncbi:hypothetical protein FRB99_003803 [Tulasnella sp. 403]|nr:hypothetical protein FRB99_003803 [Tulasnella sp. 403]
MRSRIYFPKHPEIGFGGSGVVCRANLDYVPMMSAGKPVVVKKLPIKGSTDQRLRAFTAFVRELAVWAALKHQNILPLLGYYTDKNWTVAWLISPYIGHGNIDMFLRRREYNMNERLELVRDPPIAMDFDLLTLILQAIDTAKGLEYLHTRQPPTCHGDIKALNILVNERGRALLCDFGLAKYMRGMPTGIMTTGFHQAGTVRYLSPELVHGLAERGLPSDVWAWGCLLLEIVLARVPYQTAQLDGAVVQQVMSGRLPAVIEDLECPDGLRELFNQCWSKAPDRRPTMTECLRVLSALGGERLREAIAQLADWESPEIIESYERDLINTLAVLSHLRVRHNAFDFGQNETDIATGGFATVQQARMNEGLFASSRVAVKKLFVPADRRLCVRMAIALTRELVAWASLQHAHILPLIGFYLSDNLDEAWLVSPFMENGNLSVYLASAQPDVVERTQLVIDTAEALYYLHTRDPPVCHGDIKSV